MSTEEVGYVQPWTAEEDSPFSILPNELVMSIANFLEFSDQKSCRLVCQRWLTIMDYEFWTPFNFCPIIRKLSDLNPVLSSDLDLDGINFFPTMNTYGFYGSTNYRCNIVLTDSYGWCNISVKSVHELIVECFTVTKFLKSGKLTQVKELHLIVNVGVRDPKWDFYFLEMLVQLYDFNNRNASTLEHFTFYDMYSKKSIKNNEQWDIFYNEYQKNQNYENAAAFYRTPLDALRMKNSTRVELLAYTSTEGTGIRISLPNLTTINIWFGNPVPSNVDLVDWLVRSFQNLERVKLKNGKPDMFILNECEVKKFLKLKHLESIKWSQTETSASSKGAKEIETYCEGNQQLTFTSTLSLKSKGPPKRRIKIVRNLSN